MKRRRGERMKLMTVHLPRWQLQELRRLVEEGKYPNVSEAVRVAVHKLIMEERKVEMYFKGLMTG